MMEDSVYVSCHAPCYSFLLYETARSIHDQKGFLIGNIHKEIISTTTDENEVHNEEKTALYIEHCLSITDDQLFSSVGQINKEILNGILKGSSNKVIGWYSFRRNTSLTPTLREKLIHRELLNVLPNINPDLFFLCVLTSSVSNTLSTHTYNQLFWTMNENRGMNTMKLKINTLSDKYVSSGGYLSSSNFPISQKFDKIVNGIRANRSNPVEIVLDVQREAGSYLEVLIKQLNHAENKANQLEADIVRLKQQLGIGLKEVVQPIVSIEQKEPELLEDHIRVKTFNTRKKYNTNRTKSPLYVEERPETPPLIIFEDLPVRHQSTTATTPNSTNRHSVPQTSFNRHSSPSGSQASSRNTTPLLNSASKKSWILDDDVEKLKQGSENNSPKFNVKVPTMRQGLGPPKSKINTSTADNGQDSPDLFDER